MNSHEQKLIELMAAIFHEPTDADVKLLHAIARGKVAQFSGQDAESDPQNSNSWGQLRIINSNVIRWLCIDPEAIRHIDPQRGTRRCRSN
jgi:hypothetical protein